MRAQNDSCPPHLLLAVFVLYLGLSGAESIPLSAPFDWLHEGERLGPAQLLLEGGVPFRDVYFHHGLMPEAIRPLAAFWLFGESVIADRLVGIILQPVAHVAAAALVWSVFPTFRWRVIGLIAFSLYPLQLLSRHIVVLLALWSLTVWTYRQRARWLVVAGVLTGLSYLLTSLEQATFLLATACAFPVVVVWNRINRAGGASAAVRPIVREALAILWQVAAPLGVGITAGLLPFVAYLAWQGIGETFLRDVFSRILVDTVLKRDPYPALTLMNITWYAVPGFYLFMAAYVAGRLRKDAVGEWMAVVPTLLFGLASFIYAARGCCPSYGKLATASFPFTLSIVYLLMAWVEPGGEEPKPGSRCGLSLRAKRVLAGAVLLSGAVLVHALVRDWAVKQIVPRYLFPLLSGAVLCGAAGVVAGTIGDRRWRNTLVIACPLAAVICAVWFYNEAKPQVLSAQIQKPRLAKDLVQATGYFSSGAGRLTRDIPLLLQDETLSYVKALAEKKEPVVILAAGSGMYYFLANAQPPNRFPEIYLAIADGLGAEVAAGLQRTRAVVLAACDYDGHTIMGWPMNPILSRYLTAHYEDSGMRLASERLGKECPFSVWRHREDVMPKAF